MDLNKTILLVEDEALISLATKAVLERHGSKVITASNGHDAIEIINKNSDIDMILMDIDLGDDMDGTRTAEIILKNHEIPILFLSSHTDPEIVKKTEGISSYGYVVKNTGEVVLLASIKMALRLFQANVSLHRSRDLLEATQNITGAGGWEWNIETKTMVWTKEMYRIHGLDSDFPISESAGLIRKSLACYNKKDRMRIQSAFEDCIKKGKSFNMEVPFKTYDKRNLWVQSIAHPVLRQGKVVRVIGNLVDITERKKAELDLIERSQRQEKEARIINKISGSESFAKGKIDQLAFQITEMVSEALDIDRVGIWLFNEDHTKLINLDNYNASEKKHSSGDILMKEEFINEFDALKKQKYIDAHDALNDPRTCHYAETYLNPNGIKSMLDTSIAMEGRILGTLCLEQTGNIRHWKDHEINFACQVADHISLALSNKEIIKREKKLKESEEKYRLIFENSPLGLIHYDINGIITDCNDNFVKVIGSSRKALIGLNMQKLPDKKLVIELKKSLNGEYGFYEDYYHSITAKKITPVRVLFAPLTTIEGNLTGGTGIIEDITERKNAEESLREKTRLCEHITNNMFDLVALTDLSGKIKFVGESHKILGYDLDSLIGRNVMDFVFSEDIPRVQKVFSDFLNHKLLSPRVEYRYYCMDGSYIWLETLGKFIEDEKGEISEILFSSRDITDNKIYREKLDLERKRFYMLLQNFPGFIYLQSPDYTIRYANRYFIDNFGDYQGKLCHEVLWGKKDPCRICPTFKVFDTNTPQIWEWENAPNNKVYKIYDYPFIDSDGSRLVLEIGIDITELKESKKRTEELLFKEKLLLKETHHRIRNNMNTIYAFLRIQAEERADPESAGIINEAAGSIQSMMVLYDKLYRSKTYGRISIRDYLSSLLKQILSIVHSQVPIKTDMQIEDFQIKSDILSSIGIIINELITNSIKHAFVDREEGILRIYVKRERGRVRLIYSDNGKGIPEKILSENNNTLGLQIIEMLIKQIKGEMDIEVKDGTIYKIAFDIT